MASALLWSLDIRVGEVIALKEKRPTSFLSQCVSEAIPEVQSGRTS